MIAKQIYVQNDRNAIFSQYQYTEDERVSPVRI